MKTKLALFLIILLAVFMRFYHLPELFHWTMDEEYWSYIPFNIATGYHFPLIGGSIADTGVYTTPWFVYLMSAIAFLGGGNPLFFAFFVSAVGVLTVLLVYQLGKEIVGPKAAFFAAVLTSSSALLALWDRHYWNASLTPLLSLLALYCVYRIIKNSARFFIPLALVLALAVSAHGTGLALILFTILSLIIFQPKQKRRYMVVAVLIFVLSLLPTILFDLRHDFLITKSAVSYLVTGKKTETGIATRIGDAVWLFSDTLSRTLYYDDGEDVAGQLTLCPVKPYDKGNTPLIVELGVGLVLLSFFLRKAKTSGEKLPMLLVLSTLAGLMLFKSKLSPYYSSPAVIPFFLLTGSGLAELARGKLGKLAAVAAVSFLVVLNLQKIINSYHSFSYDAKIKAVRLALEKLNNKPFSLEVQSSDPCAIYGFRYLFTYLGHEPGESYMDPYFSWFYERRLSKVEPESKLTFHVNVKKISFTVTPFIGGKP